MNHQGTQILETKRLLLRPFAANDAEAMFKNWASDPDVTKYLTWPAHDSLQASKAVLTDWLKQYKEKKFYVWAIVLKDMDEPIGSISVVKQDEQTKMVHIGYALGARWWRRGFTSEALARLLEFFFFEVGINRVESRHDPKNPYSGSVMKKCGLLYEGTQRQADWNNQGICDAAGYAILREEYMAMPNESSITR